MSDNWVAYRPNFLEIVLSIEEIQEQKRLGIRWENVIETTAPGIYLCHGLIEGPRWLFKKLWGGEPEQLP